LSAIAVLATGWIVAVALATFPYMVTVRIFIPRANTATERLTRITNEHAYNSINLVRLCRFEWCGHIVVASSRQDRARGEE
jgi:hypothetical protein